MYPNNSDPLWAGVPKPANWKYLSWAAELLMVYVPMLLFEPPTPENKSCRLLILVSPPVTL